MQTSYSSIVLSRSVLSCTRIPAHSPLLLKRMLFFEGGLSMQIRALRQALVRSRAAAYSDGCLYWGGISFMTTQPLVPATRVLETFSKEIVKIP